MAFAFQLFKTGSASLYSHPWTERALRKHGIDGTEPSFLNLKIKSNNSKKNSTCVSLSTPPHDLWGLISHHQTEDLSNWLIMLFLTWTHTLLTHSMPAALLLTLNDDTITENAGPMW